MVGRMRRRRVGRRRRRGIGRRRSRRRRTGTVTSFVVCPFGVAIKGESLFDSFMLSFAEFRRGWYQLGTTCKRVYCGKFVGFGCIAVEWDILVSVGGLAVDVKVK